MSRPSTRQINKWKEELRGIVQMPKEKKELVPGGQIKKLQKLAQEIGASTRAIGYHSDGKPFGYDAGIAELIDNIHKALQTLIFIKNCEYTRRSVCITMGAVIVSILAIISSVIFSQRSISIAQEANIIALDTLKNSYVPWLYVTFVKPTLVDSNNFEIAIKCKNFSNAPALNLNIKYDILGMTEAHQRYLYESDALMPNDERGLKLSGTVEDGSAKQIVDKLNNGELSLSCDINYEDVFGRKIEIRQALRWIMGNFSNITYEVIKGLD